LYNIFVCGIITIEVISVDEWNKIVREFSENAINYSRKSMREQWFKKNWMTLAGTVIIPLLALIWLIVQFILSA